MCGNIQPCFALNNDGDDETNQFLWLKSQHTSCTFIFIIKQRKVGSSIQSINVLKLEPIHPCKFCKFLKCGHHVCQHFTAGPCV